MKFKKIIETGEVVEYLQKRQLLKQYVKAKKYLENGLFRTIDFKLREPKQDGIYYFRINKQFRALAECTHGVLYVYKISNHQEK